MALSEFSKELFLPADVAHEWNVDGHKILAALWDREHKIVACAGWGVEGCLAAGRRHLEVGRQRDRAREREISVA